MPRRPKKKTEGGHKGHLDLYARSNEEESRKIYLRRLNDVRDAITRGNLNSLKNICNFLLEIDSIEKDENLQKHYKDPNNPFSGTNLIIFTCKHDQYDILKYFLVPEERVLFKLYEKIGHSFIHPDNIDQYQHNAFYYAIRSNDVKMVDVLSGVLAWV
uniref:Uncharacterized protein n=1 Tax=Lygus hesperus TaxID=30085 RepID=A0A0K8S4L0_LYGHE